MPQARHTQIDIEASPYYHCISRCVRRAFLCGTDPLSGRNFDHRKQWVVEKLAQLSEIYAIDVCGFAVMSNHFHLVLQIDGERARSWSDHEVRTRYCRLFKHSKSQLEGLSNNELEETVAKWRARLYDLSWFMRCLNEEIARRANSEDDCTGHFWESRFRCQALLDEKALLMCLSYVDLNPMRAGMAKSLEESRFTSIKQRLEERAGESAPKQDKDRSVRGTKVAGALRPNLIAFVGDRQGEVHEEKSGNLLPFEFESYHELLRSTAEALKEKRGGARLPQTSSEWLERQGIAAEHWVETVRNYSQRFFSVVGHRHQIDLYCARVARSHAKGKSWAGKVFRDAA